MPDLSGIPALDILLGLSFLYFLLSIVASSINEAIAAAFKLRARTLEVAIHSLLGSPEHAEAFYRHWRVGTLIKPVSKTVDRNFKTERKPSYIPSRVFALTLLDTVAPPADPPSTAPESHDVLARAHKAMDNADLPDPVRGLLADALHEAGDDVARFRHVLERSFDEVMDRASGWYKRRVQIILFVIALVLAAAINADSFDIGQRLWKDDATRTAVVAQAQKGLDATDAAGCSKAGSTAVEVAADCIGQVKQLDLPLGWQGVPHGWGYPSKLIGLLITAFALTLGAPFWFDTLGKIAHLRGSGPPTPGVEEKADKTRASMQPSPAPEPPAAGHTAKPKPKPPAT